MENMKEQAQAISWPNPHVAKMFLDEVNDWMNHRLLPEKAVAMMYEVGVMELRLLKNSAWATWMKHIEKKARKMHEEGYTIGKIALDLGYSESTIRRLLDLKD